MEVMHMFGLAFAYILHNEKIESAQRAHKRRR